MESGPTLTESPLTSDDDVLDRVTSLIRTAIRRQLWLMFLDEDHRQLPVIMPSYLPHSPGDGDADRLTAFIRGIVDDVEASTVILVFERPGRDEVTDVDRRWLRTMHRAALGCGAPFRGPLLCHDDGVRRVAVTEYEPV